MPRSLTSGTQPHKLDDVPIKPNKLVATAIRDAVTEMADVVAVDAAANALSTRHSKAGAAEAVAEAVADAAAEVTEVMARVTRIQDTVTMEVDLATMRRNSGMRCHAKNNNVFAMRAIVHATSIMSTQQTRTISPQLLDLLRLYISTQLGSNLANMAVTVVTLK